MIKGHSNLQQQVFEGNSDFFFEKKVHVDNQKTVLLISAVIIF